MSKLTSALNFADRDAVSFVKLAVTYYFENLYPQKLKKWRGKKIVSLAEWDSICLVSLDNYFDYIPEEVTNDTPKFYYLSSYREARLRLWYVDYNAYLAKLGIAPRELKFFGKNLGRIEDPAKKSKVTVD
jgi:hypothetical protein